MFYKGVRVAVVVMSFVSAPSKCIEDSSRDFNYKWTQKREEASLVSCSQVIRSSQCFIMKWTWSENKNYRRVPYCTV